VIFPAAFVDPFFKSKNPLNLNFVSNKVNGKLHTGVTCTPYVSTPTSFAENQGNGAQRSDDLRVEKTYVTLSTA
jgi:hypothetical protein